jgi:large subunit ribosomal protein L30
MMFAAVRVRGSAKVLPDTAKTLDLLMLDRVNHLVLVPENQRKMLEKARAYITFGEIDEKTLSAVLEKRGRVSGKKITQDFLKEKKLKGFDDMAKQVLEGKLSLRALGVKPVFRLGPPKKGYERKGVKRSFVSGGALGYRASDINSLIKRMV